MKCSWTKTGGLVVEASQDSGPDDMLKREPYEHFVWTEPKGCLLRAEAIAASPMEIVVTHPVEPLVTTGAGGVGSSLDANLNEVKADLNIILARRAEPCISHEEVKARLRRDGLLPS
jgi:hypothetical protein